MINISLERVTDWHFRMAPHAIGSRNQYLYILVARTNLYMGSHGVGIYIMELRAKLYRVMESVYYGDEGKAL